jgi:hypothetical protein
MYGGAEETAMSRKPLGEPLVRLKKATGKLFVGVSLIRLAPNHAALPAQPLRNFFWLRRRATHR